MHSVNLPGPDLVPATGIDPESFRVLLTLSLDDRKQPAQPMSEQIQDLIRKIAHLEEQLEAAQLERTQAHAIAIEHTQELFQRQRQFDLLIEISTVTTGADNTQDALEGILRLICTYMRWPVGHVLLRDRQNSDKMVSSKIWFSNLMIATEDFQVISEQMIFDENNGLPGQSVRSDEPVWYSDIDQSETSIRGRAAAHCGLRYALALPVQVHGKTAAILEFFSEVPIGQDPITKEILKQSSEQLARVFELQQASRVRALYSDQLEKNAEQLSRIAHIGSHDLQEPLRKIELFMTRLRRTDSNSLSESGKQSLDRIGIASARMSTLIRDLLELVYIATDQWQLSEVDLGQVMDRIRAVRMRRTLTPGDEFVIDSLPVIWAEPEVTQQVIEELIDNAIQFRGPNRALSIAVRCDPGDDAFFEIRIEDNGIGFSPEYAEQIFTPFQFLQRSESEGHTGVGLALCRRAVERLGGSLTASSDGADTGACFTIRLPDSVVLRGLPRSASPDRLRSQPLDGTPD